MCAVARDLHTFFSVFTALAAVRLVICYSAPACRMRTFLLFEISSHNDLSLVSTGFRDGSVDKNPDVTYSLGHEPNQIDFC